MISSHAEKQIIVFLAWDLLMEKFHFKSPRAWDKARKIGQPIQIVVNRIACRWCEDLCEKTNSFLGMNLKLVWICRVQNLATRCKCGGCMCDLPTPKIIIPMLQDGEGVVEASTSKTITKSKLKNQVTAVVKQYSVQLRRRQRLLEARLPRLRKNKLKKFSILIQKVIQLMNGSPSKYNQFQQQENPNSADIL